MSDAKESQSHEAVQSKFAGGPKAAPSNTIGWLDWEPKGGRAHALLLLLPLVVRLIVGVELSSNPFTDVPIIDAQHYDDVAKQIVDGTFTMTGPHWQPPLYQVFLAGVYSVCGHSLAAARMLQALLGAVSCLFVFIVTRRLFGIRPAWLAYVMASLYGTLVFQDHELLPTSLFICLELMVLWASTREGLGAKGAFGSGALLGLAAITVPNILVSAPVFAWFVAKRNATGRGARARLVAAWGLGAIVVISPVTWSNYEASGEFILVSHNNGINFFIGNNPEYDKTFAIRPGYHWKKLDMMPSLEGDAVTPRERSSFYIDKSVAWIKSEPKAYLALLGKKALLFASGTEIPRNEEIYPLRDDSRLLALLLWSNAVAFPFGVMLPLALLGIALSVRSCEDRPLRRLILTYAALHALSVVAFFVTARHRLPLVPLLLPFAGLAAYRIGQYAKERSRGPLLRSCAALAALVLLCNAWNTEPAIEFGAGTMTEVAFDRWRAGNMEESEKLLERAVRLDPSNVDAAVALADRLVKQQKPERALATLAPLGPLFPDLGLDALGKRRGSVQDLAARALAEVEPRSQLWPEKAEAELRWARRFAADGATHEANEHRIAAARLYAAIGQSYARAGRIDWAEANFRKAVEVQPDLVAAINGVGLVYAARGDLPKAAEFWLRTLKLDPSNAEAQGLLAKARPALELELAKQHL